MCHVHVEQSPRFPQREHLLVLRQSRGLLHYHAWSVQYADAPRTCVPHTIPFGGQRRTPQCVPSLFLASAVMALWYAAVSRVSCRQSMSALDVSTCLQCRLTDVTLADSTIRGPGRGWMSPLRANNIRAKSYSIDHQASRLGVVLWPHTEHALRPKPLCVIVRAHHRSSALAHHCPTPRLHCSCPRPLCCLPRSAGISMAPAWPPPGWGLPPPCVECISSWCPGPRACAGLRPAG